MTDAPPLSYVVDTSVLVARFLESDAHHSKVLAYWDNLEKGHCRFHIPALAIVESAGAINRRSSVTNMAAAVHRLRQLIGRGHIVEYQLDDQRRNQALSMVVRYKLRSADAIFVALAEEL